MKQLSSNITIFFAGYCLMCGASIPACRWKPINNKIILLFLLVRFAAKINWWREVLLVCNVIWSCGWLKVSVIFLIKILYTDVMIIAITLIDTSKQVLVDYRNDKNRKGVWLYSIALNDNIRAALIGSHAFTGNDYASSFFKRGKYGYFKVMKQ